MSLFNKFCRLPHLGITLSRAVFICGCVGGNVVQVEVKVITQVSVENVEVNVVDKEHSSVQKSTK
jgi:hypothetical protein